MRQWRGRHLFCEAEAHALAVWQLLRLLEFFYFHLHAAVPYFRCVLGQRHGSITESGDTQNHSFSCVRACTWACGRGAT